MAITRWATHLDLLTNEIQNAVIQNLSSAPSGIAGRIFYNSATGDFSWYDGVADEWKSAGTGTGYTDEDARDAIAAALVGGTGIEISVNDGADTITIAIDSAILGAANGIATLDSGGLVPSDQLPAIAITDVYVVEDNTERDALTVESGDVAIVTDDSVSYIYDGTDWIELIVPAGGITGITAGDGLASTGGSTPSLSVNVDDSTLEINTDTLRVKDAGITDAKLATAPIKRYATTWTGAGATATITHSIGRQYVTVAVYDENDEQLHGVSVDCTSTTALGLAVNTAPGANTWNVVVVG